MASAAARPILGQVVPAPPEEHMISEEEPEERDFFPQAFPSDSRRRIPTGSTRQWLGCGVKDAAVGLAGSQYTEKRELVSNAAFVGRWHGLFAAIELGRRTYAEEWINAYRLKSIWQLDIQTRWTPLHQAAFMGAPLEIVRDMINLGAYRTQRTRRTDPWITHDEMTAHEIAIMVGHDDLAEVLKPVILHPLPRDTIDKLQLQLKKLSSILFAGDLEDYSLSVPDINILTELEDPEIVMIIPDMRNAARRMFVYLDGNELSVKFVSRHVSMHAFRKTAKDGDQEFKRFYRVTCDGWKEDDKEARPSNS